MRISALAETGLGISEDQITTLFAPFVSQPSGAFDPLWRQEITRRRLKHLRHAARRLFMGWLPETRRDEDTVRTEYERGWAGIDYARYTLDAPLDGATPWEWRGRQMFATDTGATRVRQLFLIRILERLRPRSVLEVGCGNGINLLLLAGRFPQIAFSGLELTEAGHAAAVAFQRHAALPREMKAYAPEAIEDPQAFKRIAFVQGNAVAMPFADGAIDLVYTTLALEQMERVRGAALSEIARVAGRNTFMVEPFRDVNKAFWPRLYVYRRNYFRGAIDDLEHYGLRPVLATDDFPQEVFLKACAVLTEKKSA
ncbi:putative Methyltransferase domain-containing protein [Candidatus Defluviicoccus seviourii]|uniref:Methyltransferase domain-containing protein n=1 Tax=Candidatus Defluviicoccus seviourii TaxID=2565273 RepID=A0A564WGT6_9PROT|nr:putative Methyltransferase domain-containing protein [Candidatus Defluviicoccus seviourii]